MIIFYKMQALGNDFVVIDCTKKELEYDLKIVSKYFCDRHFGAGADGVIYIYSSKLCDLKMRIFNQDGSEAEMCGNGIRCLAKFAFQKKLINKNEFSVETLAGIKKVKIYDEDSEKIEVNMGNVKFDLEKVPVYLPNDLEVNNGEFKIEIEKRIFNMNSVSVGNPHTVCFVENLEEIDVNKYGSLIENYKYFPEKTNVEFVEVKDKNKIKVKVWERGVGRTLGCGTGAVASMAVANRKLYTDCDVIVNLDGGSLEIKKVDNEFFIIGDAKFVYEGKIEF